MFRADRKMIIGILFLVPVMLCLMGVGAFLHVAVRAAVVQDEQAGQRARKQIEEDKTMADGLSEAIHEIQRQIEQIRKRVAEVKQAEDCQAESAQLQALKEQLQAELSSLRSKLEELEERQRNRGEDCDDSRRQVAEARRKLDELEQKLAEMVPSSNGPEDDNPPKEGPSLAELREEIAQAEGQKKDQDRKSEQAQTEWNGLRQERPDDPTIEVEKIRGTENWQPPPNPLYVECDGQGIVLQPENVRLPIQPGEGEEDRFVRLAHQREYVLFLIRPDGFESFWRYRPLIKEGTDFGYEPINQQGLVNYPEES